LPRARRPFTAAAGGSYDPHGQRQSSRPFTVLNEQFNRSSKVLSRDYVGYIIALRALPRSKGGLFAAHRESGFLQRCGTDNSGQAG